MHVDFSKDKVCSKEDRYRLFNETDLMLLDENQIGPDEIIIQFEGASVQAQVARTNDNCREYFAMFQVPLAGAYRLKVARLRKDYSAAKEGEFYPEINYELFLDVLIDENVGVYAPEPCSRGRQGFWVTNRNKHLLVESMKLKDQCRSGGERRGLPLSTNIILKDQFLQDGCVTDVENFGWNRKICRHDYEHYRDALGEIVVYGHPNITASRPYEYFKRRKILFIGDNHMKGLAQLFINHVCHYDDKKLSWNDTFISVSNRHDELEKVAYTKLFFKEENYDDYREPVDKCRKDKDINNCLAYKNAADPKEKRRIFECFHDPSSRACDLFDLDCAGSSVSYINAMHCQKDLGKFMEGYDYVVLNCGHHTAKSIEFPYHVYRELIKTLSKNLEYTPVVSKSKLFYLENSAVPLRQDGRSVAEVDRRTYHRLIMFDAIAKHEMQKAGLHVHYVPAFDSTLALFDKFCDCGHFPYSAKMPQLLALTTEMKRALVIKRGK